MLGHEDSSPLARREVLRNERLYDRMVDLRSANPTRFDRLHPILGGMLTKGSSFEYWHNRWQANPARFEHWHPLFWRIIDGESLAGGPPGNPPSPISPLSPFIPPVIPPAGQDGNPPVSPNTPTAPPTPPTPPAPPASVPEPGTSLLVIEALGLILLARGGYAFLRGKWEKASQ